MYPLTSVLSRGRGCGLVNRQFEDSVVFPPKADPPTAESTLLDVLNLLFWTSMIGNTKWRMTMKIVKKIMKWLGIGIGTLLVLIILASLIMNVIFGRELRQTMEKLKAEGRALTVDEFRPAPITHEHT